MGSETKRPEWLPEELFPFESRYADVAGCRVHYIDEGSGPTLLFLHGNPTWSFLYRNIVLALRDSFRCVALDYPGFGLSSAPASYGHTAAEHADVVEEFVVDGGLRDVTLMGQDWGGPIGLTVAARHPDRFSGFILGNTWAWPLNGILNFELASRLMGNPLAKLAIRNANIFVNVMIPAGTSHRLPGDVMAAYRGPFPSPESREPTWIFARQLLETESFMRSLEERHDRLAHLPALLLWGGGDFALRKNVELPRFEKVFPNHETVVLDRARHFFQEDAPEEAADAIRRWFETRERRT